MAGGCGSLDCADPRAHVDSHAWTPVNEGCPGPPICCDPDQEDRALSSAALVLAIFLAVSAYSSRLRRGWPRAYPARWRIGRYPSTWIAPVCPSIARRRLLQLRVLRLGLFVDRNVGSASL